MKALHCCNRLRSDEYIGTAHIAVQRHRTGTCVQHWHNYFEIELILSGTAEHICNGSRYTLEKGDAYLLTPVDFHGIEAREPLELINISFDEGFLSTGMLSLLSASGGTRCRFVREEFDRFYMAAELLRHECETRGPCAPQLLEYLLSCFARRTDNPVQDIQKEHLQGINKALSYIELHFREPICLEQLATLSGYNPSYFSELFRKVTGQTYKERLRELRIRYAKMLLANGFSVSEACFASGFGSLSNFSATFREVCSVSPNAYRKAMLTAGKEYSP